MVSGEREGGLPVYLWRTAPPHLRTRRQLRALGLSPGRQDIAAKMIRPRRRRGPLLAYLFHTDKAVPTRTDRSPAQLAALAAANRERQFAAAERRGISRDELLTPGDPGPGWDTPIPDRVVAAPLVPADPEPVTQSVAEPVIAERVSQAPIRVESAVADPVLAPGRASPRRSSTRRVRSSLPATKGTAMQHHEDEQIVTETAQLVHAGAQALIAARHEVRRWASQREAVATAQRERKPGFLQRLFGRRKDKSSGAERKPGLWQRFFGRRKDRDTGVQAGANTPAAVAPQAAAAVNAPPVATTAQAANTQATPPAAAAANTPVTAQAAQDAAQATALEQTIGKWAAAEASREYAQQVVREWEQQVAELDKELTAAGLDPDSIRVKAAQPQVDIERVKRLAAQYTRTDLEAALAVQDQQEKAPAQAQTTAATPAQHTPAKAAAKTPEKAAAKKAPAKAATAAKGSATTKSAPSTTASTTTAQSATSATSKANTDLVGASTTGKSTTTTAQTPPDPQQQQQQQATQQAAQTAAATAGADAGVAP